MGDFNGDGIPDLALANYGDGFGNRAGVSILLGKGDGTFHPLQYYPAGVEPFFLAVGDLNGDGHLDLAMTDGHTLHILLGKGDGTFEVPVLYAANGGPVAVAVADFNGDGIPDLAVVNGGIPGSVSILLGKGDGTFQAARSYWSGGSPLGFTAVAAGDFNGDGIPDFVVTNSADGTATILLGKGDGSFQLGQTYAAGGRAVAVGDFNGDGIADLVVVTGILLGNGDGTFQPLLPFTAGKGPNFLAVGDFNGDGKLDIVTTNFAVVGDPRHYEIVENGVRVLLGNGDGTFGAAQAYAIQPGNSRPSRVVVADFNGDGSPDLAVLSAESGAVSILLGKGDGTFAAAQNYGIGLNLLALAVGDFNGDGHLDLIVASHWSFKGPRVTLLLGKGNGTFKAAQSFSVGSVPESVAVADFNGDGIPDLAVADSSGVSLLLGNGDGTFQNRRSYAAGSGGLLVVADWNGDGWPDLGLSNSATVLLNQP